MWEGTSGLSITRKKRHALSPEYNGSSAHYQQEAHLWQAASLKRRENIAVFILRDAKANVWQFDTDAALGGHLIHTLPELCFAQDDQFASKGLEVPNLFPHGWD